ncbi:MAG: polysaccharide deacetylase family protein [Clostridiales bacterium]|nr:polysaccharide deacetylase family protein [Clostridiales bacterium]
MRYTQNKLIALTFDDGPSDTTTGHVLDVLERHGIVGTFFLIGDNITDERIPIIKRTLSLGCEIENHSKTHSDMRTLTRDEIISEISCTTDRIIEVTGRAPEFFRPPYIYYNDTMFDAIDLTFICGLGCEDWEAETTAEHRAEKTIAQAEDGAVILLHDFEDNEKTVEALETIIPALKDKGYEFVTVSEMFRRKGVDLTKQRGILFNVTSQARG